MDSGDYAFLLGHITFLVTVLLAFIFYQAFTGNKQIKEAKEELNQFKKESHKTIEEQKRLLERSQEALDEIKPILEKGQKLLNTAGEMEKRMEEENKKLKKKIDEARNLAEYAYYGT